MWTEHEDARLFHRLRHPGCNDAQGLILGGSGDIAALDDQIGRVHPWVMIAWISAIPEFMYHYSFRVKQSEEEELCA